MGKWLMRESNHRTIVIRGLSGVVVVWLAFSLSIQFFVPSSFVSIEGFYSTMRFLDYVAIATSLVLVLRLLYSFRKHENRET